MGIAEFTVKKGGRVTNRFKARNFVTTEGMEALLKATFNSIQPRPMYHDVVNGIYMGGLYMGAIIQLQDDGNGNILVGGPMDVTDTWDTKQWFDWPYAGGKIYTTQNNHGGCLGFFDPPPPPQYIAQINQLKYPIHTYTNVGELNFTSYPDPKVYGTRNKVVQGFYTGFFYDNDTYPNESTFQLFSIIPLQVPLDVPYLPFSVGVRYNLSVQELLT